MIINQLNSYSLTTIIGSGGKTSTLYKLGHGFNKRNQSVLLTTTTAMGLPNHNPSLKVIIEPNIEVLYKYLNNLDKPYKVFAAKSLIKADKVKGYKAEELVWLNNKLKKVNIIVEGDGSDGKSLKIPETWEPVIPESTNQTIVVIGWDIMGKLIKEEWIHRSSLLYKKDFINNINTLPDFVDEEMIIKLLEDSTGLLKGIPESSSVILLLNKVITEIEKEKAKEMANKILEKIPRIKKVFLGQIKERITLIER